MWEHLDRTLPHTDGMCGQGCTLEEMIQYYDGFITRRSAYEMEPTKNSDTVSKELLNVEALWKSEVDKKQSRNYL